MKKKIIRITEGEFLDLMTNLVKEEITKRMMCEVQGTVSDDGATVGEEEPSIMKQIGNAAKYTGKKILGNFMKRAGMDPIENKKKKFTDSESFKNLTPKEQETIKKFHKSYYGK